MAHLDKMNSLLWTEEEFHENDKEILSTADVN